VRDEAAALIEETSWLRVVVHPLWMMPLHCNLMIVSRPGTRAGAIAEPDEM